MSSTVMIGNRIMSSTKPQPAIRHSKPAEMTELLAYRLHKVANLVSRSAALRYKREFDVLLWEWRTLALLGAAGAMSLGELAKAAGLDKAQISRVASGLTARGLVRREPDEVDTRRISLSLTREGKRVYKGLNLASNERNTEFLECLTASEQKALGSILSKLESKAHALIAKEKAIDP
jgi:DNA-binding MarR family transcriptional regulator